MEQEESFKWAAPHRASRTELLSGTIPTFTEVVNGIETSQATDMEKALLYIMITTSARVSEACGVRVNDIKVYLKPNYEITYESSKNYTTDPRSGQPIDIYDISKIIINLSNLKRKNKNARKAIPVINNELCTGPIKFIWDYMKHLNDPKALIYTKSRKCAWWIFKRYPEINRVLPFPHSTRHISLSQLTKAGVDVSIIKEIAGWSNLNPFSQYVHLNTKHIEEKLREVYGNDLERLMPDNRPISLTKAYAGHLAAYELGRGTSPKYSTPHNYSRGRAQHYKYSTIATDDEKIMVNERTNPKIRYLADKIRREKPFVKAFNDELKQKIREKLAKPVEQTAEVVNEVPLLEVV